MTPFVKALRLKGWSAKQVAERWGILPRQMSRIGNSPKQIHWDALEGLPDNKKITGDNMGFKNENEIIKVEGGWKLSNGNATSVDTYENFEDAVDADIADKEAWENASDAAEAEEYSPVEWEA